MLSEVKVVTIQVSSMTILVEGRRLGMDSIAEVLKQSLIFSGLNQTELNELAGLTQDAFNQVTIAGTTPSMNLGTDLWTTADTDRWYRDAADRHLRVGRGSL